MMLLFVTKRCHRSWKKYLAVSILIIFCAAYYIRIFVRLSILGLIWGLEESEQLETPNEHMELNCEIPHLDPFSKEATKYDKQIPGITCKGKDWVKCYHSQCRVRNEVFSTFKNIVCTYNDIIYESDDEFNFGPSIFVKGNDTYTLIKSDHVKVACVGKGKNGLLNNWTYYSTGFRNSVDRMTPPLGRDDSLNVLILMFDSTSRTDFIRKLPQSYEYLTKILNGTVLKGYNIVGDGTPGALLPILTGNMENDLPRSLRRQLKKNRSLDSIPFIFYKLKEDGYRTAYFEDMPWIGTFQYKYDGFRHQPADHYLRDFFAEEAWIKKRAWSSKDNERFCVGDTPQYQLMLNKTFQFLLLDGKRFCLTLIADITHDDFNLLSIADGPLLNFLQMLVEKDLLRDTLLIVMGDHGPRFGDLRLTLHGRFEERLPFVCVILPEKLKRKRPDAQAALESNANTWTTPYDVHTTILDALNLPQHINLYKVPGANIPRSMSFLRPIPKNRTCWEAGIRPYWCTCIAWRNVPMTDKLYQKAAQSLLRYINLLTDPVRSKCAFRTLTEIKWVKRYGVNRHMLTSLNGVIQNKNDHFLVKIVSGPGEAIYEAAMIYVHKHNKFFIEEKDISRINAYGKEPSCISAVRPHLNMFCYCTVNRQKLIS